MTLKSTPINSNSFKVAITTDGGTDLRHFSDSVFLWSFTDNSIDLGKCTKKASADAFLDIDEDSSVLCLNCFVTDELVNTLIRYNGQNAVVDITQNTLDGTRLCSHTFHIKVALPRDVGGDAHDSTQQVYSLYLACHEFELFHV